ncbi:MAG: hypothetical protein PGN13_04985 [Patulibacter minatonensis]
MAFFDDDPPTQQRRSTGPPNPPRPPRPKSVQDQQTIWARRGVAGVIFLLFLIIVGLGLNGCVNSSRKNALQDYGQAVGEIGTESSSNVSQGLTLLARPGDQEALAQRNALDKLATDSRSLTERARKLSTPGGLEGATQNLVTALSLRADALSRIADRIATARGTSRAQAEDATKQIAGQMEALLASDVLWQLRVTPYIKDRAEELDVRDDGVEDSVVLTNLGWLNAGTVANRIDGQTDTDDASAQTQCVAGSPHGHGLTAVSANGKTLTEGSSAVTTIPNGSGLSFVVSIANQGDNDETGVLVSISGTSKATGKEVFSETKKVAKTTKGAASQVTIPITAAVSSAVTVTAEVKPVACEINKANNKKTFQVIFG